MYTFSDKRSSADELNINNLVVVKVDSIKTFLEAREQLKLLKSFHDKLGETKAEYDPESDAVTDAILEQEEQMDCFVNTRKTFNSQIFSKNLDLLLKREGMKISDLEAILNVSSGYISRAVGQDSKKRVSIDIVWEMADLFQINLDNLLNRDISTPSKDVKHVVGFIGKLIEDTEECKVHWEKIKTTPNEDLEMFFVGDSNGKVFLPNAFPSENCGLRSAYKVTLNVGVLFFFQEDSFVEENEYSMYLFDEQLYSESQGRADPLVQIIITSQDSSGVLEAECKKLLNSIKTHEKDFVVSVEAKRLINKYLTGVAYGSDEDELPF